LSITNYHGKQGDMKEKNLSITNYRGKDGHMKDKTGLLLL